MSQQADLDRIVHAPVPAGLKFLGRALCKLLDDASNELERDSDAARRSLARASALLREGFAASQHKEQHATAPSRLTPWQVRRVRAYVEAHLHEPIRVAELAAVSCLSVSYFSVACRRSFGMPLGKLLARLRVERARELMLSTDQPLSQIALASGFCDQAHLSRQFRHLTGATPQAWRREHRSGPVFVMLPCRQEAAEQNIEAAH
jgi:AraC family transcriptional regulator